MDCSSNDFTTEQRLAALAAATGRSQADLRTLATHELEDLEDFHLASATMERVRKGQERVYSLNDVERGLHQ